MNQIDSAALLDLARNTIVAGLESGRRSGLPPLAGLPPSLHRPAGAFVTLSRQQALRGCIGSLEARWPLAHAVASAAFNAAFCDPRFVPLLATELTDVSLEISVLGPLEPLSFASEVELLAILEPHSDGLLIEQDGCRATFLPRVWASLATPEDFLSELKRKAGLAPAIPLVSARAWRYRVEVLEGHFVSETPKVPIV